MKQFDPVNVTVTGYKFHIFPFPAFKAANMSGELVKVLGPALGSLLTLLGGEDEQGGSNLLDVDLEKSAPAIAGAFASIDGDKIEGLLKRLLLSGKNVTVTIDGETEYVSEDTLNDIFCGSVEGMFVLAFHVIKTNFGGFFKKFENLSGVVGKKLQAMKTPNDTEN